MKVTTTAQFEVLVREMKKNPQIAKGFRKGMAAKFFKADWEEVATEINALGPPERSSEGWQKVWKDLKFKVKKKMISNKQVMRSAGGGINKQIPLSPIDKEVANLMQYEKQIQPEGAVLGLGTKNSRKQKQENLIELGYSDSAEENISDDASRSKLVNHKKKNQVDNDTDSTTLLQKQIELQENQYNEIRSTLKLVQCHLKECARYQKKRLSLEEERFHIFKRKAMKEEELNNLELQIKKRKLQLIEKQINS